MTERDNNSDIQLRKGMECLLHITGRHFMVKVLDVSGDLVRVSFPGQDYPIEGIGANIEFHDENGFYYMPAEVIQGPMDAAGTVVLRRTPQVRRNTHRRSFRVPTDLTVQLKEQVHIRRYTAALMNLSAGGALVLTEAPFDFNSVLDLMLSLPGEQPSRVTCEVVHIAESVSKNNTPVRYLGLRFLDVETETEEAITRYVWQQLRILYPAARFTQPE